MKISWYPGHMNKARKELAHSLQTAHAVIEILDARAPLASSNPLLAEMTADLPTLKILNKADLAQSETSEAWLRYFNAATAAAKVNAINCGSNKQHISQQITTALNQLSTGDSEEMITTRHALVIGIPNVGKSTIINALTGRKATRTGNEPAITKSQQKVRLNDNWMLIDTPGMMWPNLADQRAALCLALLGSIRQTALDIEDIGWQAAELLTETHPEHLQERYSLPTNPESTEAIMTGIARHAGALGKSGKVDWHRAAEALLNDFRSGKLGRISLEAPPQ